MDETITLFRPIGSKELALVAASGYRKFPPRLPEQPIFYPVTNEEYAVQIARDWNARLNEDHAGFVTRFNIRKDFLNRYETHTVGASIHEEYWIPSADLEEFNSNIVGDIEVISEFRHPK
jgi:hypothetical protein